MDPDDDVVVFPLAGWAIKTLPQARLVLEVQLLPNQAAAETGERKVIPIFLTAAHARELGEILIKAAESAAMGIPATQTRN